jgi:glycosyltransferase involved in cell wall biosynthesis
VGYGFTATGWGQLSAALPVGVRSSRGPMPAAALLRVWERIDHPAVEWWSGRVDVVHGTNFVVPPSGRAARLVSVWDLTAVRYPELCTPTSRRYPALIERAIERGAWVHTGSPSVAAEIVAHFRIDPAHVRVIPPGVDPAGPAEALTVVAASPPYVLGLGTVEPRKDFPGLVAAFDAIAEDYPDLELRIAGPTGWGERDLTLAIARAVHRGRIHRMGWVPDVRALLAGAAVFAYPSLYEGFGLPPLEAMSMGVPVVATTAGSVPDLVGDSAVLVAPGDPDALAGALARVLTDSALRDHLVAAGRLRAATFRWADSADALTALYLELAGK